MRILTVSDVVEPSLYKAFDAHRFAGVDLVLACGDLPPEYLSSLVSALDAPLYYVCGNHDIRMATSPPRGCVNLHGRIVRHRGLRLLGLEGSRWYNGGIYQYREIQMRWLLRRLWLPLRLGGRLDIVIAHAPPRHMGDAEDRCHRGFESFRRLIDVHRPRYFVHGHIHRLFPEPEARITRIGPTQVINSYGYTLLDA